MALPPSAQARDWTLEAGAQAQLRHENNPGLVAEPAARETSTRQQLSAHGAARRGDETGELAAEAELTLNRDPGTAQDTALGRLGLRQALNAERHAWRAALNFRRDRPLDSPEASAGEVVLGATEQSTTELDAGWTYRWHERLRSELQGSRTRHVPSAAAGRRAEAYTVTTTSLGLNHAYLETADLSLSFSRTGQQLERSGSRTLIDSLRLGWSQAWNERVSWNASVAQSVTTQRLTLYGLACPLPVQFCDAGIVAPVVTTTPLQLRRTALQYSLGGSLRWQPELTAAASIGRTLTPGPLGVDRQDRASVSLAHSWSERLRGSLALESSRSAPASAPGASTARLDTLLMEGSWRLAEPLTVVVQAQLRRYAGPFQTRDASSRVFSISLQYLDATVAGWR